MKKEKKILYLASSSFSRAELLKTAGIPYKILLQDADELVCDWNLPLNKLVLAIAEHKMNHVIMPVDNKEGDACFVVTADTLSQSFDGKINGKPLDRDDAKNKIKKARKGNSLCSAFCLEKRVWHGNSWKTEKRISNIVCAELIFDIPDNMIDWYLDNSIAMKCSGAIQVEDLGQLFLKTISGSYSTIVGLPLFELRESLTELHFFD